MKYRVLLGITSGIAAFKTLDLITSLKQEGVGVFVIMTKHATKVISPEELEKISGNKVHVELFEKNFDYKKILEARTVDHIAFADTADLMVIAPATANTIAKLAHGIADDFLTTTALAMTKPIIICPSMNVNMWNNPLVQENITKLQKNGYIIIEPTEGMLACGYEGVGKLADLMTIKNEILRQLHQTTALQGKKVLITAGGTRENIDEVRYITNRSSGKMGIAIAEACYLRGADVFLLRAQNAVKPRYLLKEATFTSTEELFVLVKKHIKKYDYLYHTAAVSDFSVVKPVKGKISSKNNFSLQLKPQIKISDYVKKLHAKITFIAFKAEYNLPEKALINTALKNLQDSNADIVIANDISKNDRGFETDMNEVIVVLPNGTTKKLPYASKKEIAKQIVDYVSEKPHKTRN